MKTREDYREGEKVNKTKGRQKESQGRERGTVQTRGESRGGRGHERDEEG